MRNEIFQLMGHVMGEWGWYHLKQNVTIQIGRCPERKILGVLTVGCRLKAVRKSGNMSHVEGMSDAKICCFFAKMREKHFSDSFKSSA